MRLRPTAFPSAFLMLQPNRLTSRPLGRRKIVNSRLDLRRPALYTASYSARRISRQARGNPSPGASDARKAVTSLFAALCKDFPSTLALHTCAETVLFMTAAHMRLKSTFRQESSPLSGLYYCPLFSVLCAERGRRHLMPRYPPCYVMIRVQNPVSIKSPNVSEANSVVEHRNRVKKRSRFMQRPYCRGAVGPCYTSWPVV